MCLQEVRKFTLCTYKRNKVIKINNYLHITTDLSQLFHQGKPNLFGTDSVLPQEAFQQPEIFRI